MRCARFDAGINKHDHFFSFFYHHAHVVVRCVACALLLAGTGMNERLHGMNGGRLLPYSLRVAPDIRQDGGKRYITAGLMCNRGPVDDLKYLEYAVHEEVV